MLLHNVQTTNGLLAMTITDLEAKLIIIGSECHHDYSCLASMSYPVPVDSIQVVETGTAYVRFCNECGLEVERVEK